MSEEYTPIDVYNATINGDTNRLLAALAYGESIGDSTTTWYKDTNGDTAIHMASLQGNTDCYHQHYHHHHHHHHH